MQVYDESTVRTARARIRLNWSREFSFSPRQINHISESIPAGRGVYAVYSKDYLFPYDSPLWPTQRWSSRVYLGSGWISKRLCRHLSRRENDVLSGYIESFKLVCRYAFIAEEEEDWPKITEASLLRLFTEKFGDLPPANRRWEYIPDLDLDLLHIDESGNFHFVARGE
jgi:hypothetical protein